MTESSIVPSMVAELVELVEDGTISSKQAKEVFAEMAETGDAPGAIVELKGMQQVSDSGAIEEVVDRVMAANPAEPSRLRRTPDPPRLTDRQAPSVQSRVVSASIFLRWVGRTLSSSHRRRGITWQLQEKSAFWQFVG